MNNKLENKINVWDIIINGFALFAIFFGAGNMILPPYLGYHSGSNWMFAWLGFSISGPILTMFGFIAMAKCKGSVYNFAHKVSPIFSIIIGSIAMLLMGPIMAVPRTAATTFEMSIQPYFNNFDPLLFSIIFFALALFFVLNRSDMLNIVGKYMTPVILITLFIIIARGVVVLNIKPMTTPPKQFSNGIIEGYQTMDALGPIILAGTIINSFMAKGISDDRSLLRYTIYTEIVAAIGLITVYGGLTLLGSRAFDIVDPSAGRTELLFGIVNYLLGYNGNIILSLAVGLACLTTAIGLISATGEFFNYITKRKLSYNFIVIVTSILCIIFSVKGVEQILKYSVPILVTIFPAVIVLIILNLVDNGQISHIIYKSSVFMTLIISLIEGLDILFDFQYVNYLPLWDQGFTWIFGSIVGLIIGLILTKNLE